MSLPELQKFTFTSKYARYLPNKQRRETWKESVERSKDMMIQKYPMVEEEINWAYDLVIKKRVLGSQRALQFGGEPILKKNARIFNCTSSYIDRLRFFQECMYLLLCGCGTGFSVQKHHIEKLPELLKEKKDNKKFPIEDSIEGWSNAIGVLVSSYFKQSELFPEYNGYNVQFDYRSIRPEGSYLSSSSGKAPGPEPLKRALGKIRNILDNVINSGFKKIRPIDCYDIVMHAANAVVSGGVRRSATICIFSPDDEEMLNAKIGNWIYENPQRGRSNNSVLLLKDQTSFENFKNIVLRTKEYGEPGFVFADDLEFISNPCLSGDTRISTENGLIKIEDLYLEHEPTRVICDNRILKNNINIKNTGIEVRTASPVQLTQKQAKIFRVETNRGYYVDATSNHTFITSNGRKQLKDLKTGDKLLLQSDEGKFGNIGSFEEGFVLGLITSDGTFEKKDKCAYIELWEDDFNHLSQIETYVENIVNQIPSNHALRHTSTYSSKFYKTTALSVKQKQRIGGVRLYRFLQQNLGIEYPPDIKKRVPECVFRGSREFVCGYLQGFLFGDGTINESSHRKNNAGTISIRFTQSNKKILSDIQKMIQNFGITSSLLLRKRAQYRILPDSKRNPKKYFCKDLYELIIGKPSVIKFMAKIGLPPNKNKKAQDYFNNRQYTNNHKIRYYDIIKNITFLKVDDVYCLNEPKSNSIITNGLCNGQCLEIGFFCYDENGNSGWQMCNLSTINCSKILCEEDFYESCKAAAIIGTLQAGFTNFPYLGSITESIVRREALLGVSMTGIMEQHKICLDPNVQKKGVQVIKKTNKEIASKININIAARLTCVKPEGTSSCVLGTCSGIHPHHYKRYIRRVQCNKLDPVYQFFRNNNILACEESVWSENNTDDVISFCIEVPDGSKTKNQISAIELLESVKKTQQNWVIPGTNKDICVKPWLNHNVSNTITVKDNEWDEVIKYIYDNRQYFCGVSLLSFSGDKDFTQAPFTSIHLPSEIVNMYGDGAMFTSGLVEKALELFEDDLWFACDVLLGFKPQSKGKSKQEWVNKCKSFSYKYNGGDIRKLTYCMKDVYNWKLWLDLNREYQSVDYTQLIEEQDFTAFETESACAGGKCEI